MMDLDFAGLWCLWHHIAPLGDVGIEASARNLLPLYSELSRSTFPCSATDVRELYKARKLVSYHRGLYIAATGLSMGDGSWSGEIGRAHV